MSTTAKNERLAALTANGTAVWLDSLSRHALDAGELEQLRDESSLRGVTSNPSIFKKAILDSDDYDDEIREASDGSVTEVYDRLVVPDIQRACDTLRPVWDELDHADGFVSLEVAPNLANDTDGTLEEARKYWGLVDRPNLMVKVPGTTEGVPAIETLLYEGINVNVTLLFAVGSYQNVMEAYVSAMERRHAEGKSLDVHSVASFFVSRVDSKVDKQLPDDSPLRGTAALANARAAYAAYQEVFEGERFAQLREAGCPVQRPLWASTGVKDPDYPDTMYVDGLVGPNTVNTMPGDTLKAAAASTEPLPERSVTDPFEDDLKALADAGIDMEQVVQELLDEGVDLFKDAMTELLEGIEKARNEKAGS